MGKRYYIAYGSNLNLDQMGFRCPDAKAVGTARLDGWELLFKGSKTGSYLTIEPKKGGSVPVAVWEVSEADEAKLDRYEGFPAFYYKKELQVSAVDIDTGKTETCRGFVYIMREDRPLGIPTPYYVSVCADGYRSFGFDLNILADAYDKSREALR